MVRSSIVMNDFSQKVRDAQEGSANAYAEIMRLHYADVFRFIKTMIKDDAIAEDLAQETWIKIWKSLRTFDVSKKFITWSFQIAKNTVIDFTRKHKIVTVSDLSDSDIDVTDDAPLPEYVLASEEVAGEIRDAIADLGGLYAPIILMHLEQGLTFAEIAEVLGESVDTVKSRYRRGLLKIKPLFAPN